MIQEQTGSSIQVPKTGNADNPLIRTLNITCPQLHGAQRAKEMVEDVLKTKPGYQQQMRLLQQQGAQMAHQHHQPTEVSVMVNIPDKDVGLCIGKQGIVIKYMQNTTQTKIQIPPSVANPGDTYRTATIIGQALDSCNQVKSMIERIVLEQSSQWIMAAAQNMQYTNNTQQQQTFGGNGHYNQYDASTSTGAGAYQQQSYYNQQHYDPNQQQHQPQQQGYSAEWAAYHAAVAAQQQFPTEVVSAVPASATPVVTATAANQQQQPTSADAYYEQFFRYSYYYGDDAARQYYGAWAPPVGTPNPYGINPSLQPAPTAAGVGAVAAGLGMASAITEAGIASSQDSDTRETSRRQVSNLPAWMTQK
jgi:far upstream element-binding protein